MECVGLEPSLRLYYTLTVHDLLEGVMQLETKTVTASIPLSTIHVLVSKGEMGRALRTLGFALVIAKPQDSFRVTLGGFRPHFTYVIKLEAKNDKLGALLVGIRPGDMPRGFVPREHGAWLLFEPAEGSDFAWEANALAIDPHFPIESEVDEREWDFYAELALYLKRKR